MKTKEELNALKKEVKAVREKLAELTEEELAQVVGGLSDSSFDTEKSGDPKEFHVYTFETEEEAKEKFFQK